MSCTVRNGRIPFPHPTAASHFTTAPLHAVENDPDEIRCLIVRLTQPMYFAALEAPAQSHAAAMVSRMSWIAVGFWHRFVAQESSPRASPENDPRMPVSSRTDAISSERSRAPFIKSTPLASTAGLILPRTTSPR